MAEISAKLCLTQPQKTTLSSMQIFLDDVIFLYRDSFKNLPNLENNAIELSKKIENALWRFHQIEFNELNAFDNNELYTTLRNHCYNHKNTLDELNKRINILFKTKG